MAHYLKSAEFVQRLLSLREAGPIQFMMGDTTVSARPEPELLDGDALDLQFSGYGLESMKLEVTLRDLVETKRTHLFISAGPWGYGYSPEESYYLFIHDARRRKAHQIDLLSLLTEDHINHRLLLSSPLRFPFKGGREARLQLTDWLITNGMRHWDNYLLLGGDDDVKEVLENLIRIGLLKQHVRGHEIIASLVDVLPPRATA